MNNNTFDKINNKYNVLLYYYYAEIKDPEKFRKQHHIFCANNSLRGRIIISKEGINGTVSGLKKDCDLYIKHIKSNVLFKNIEFKIEEHNKHAFSKLNVRLKNEIVNSSFKNLDLNKKKGKYIEPNEFIKLKNNEDYVILDVRSIYEHEQGSFKGSLKLKINHFREFADQIQNLEKYKNKKIITFCTGGIRCEKASSLLLESGFKDVYQLHGGIIKYKHETDGEEFEGECYVFDNRISIPVNKKNPSIINKCFVCKQPSNRIINCANSTCNAHKAICNECSNKLEGACSTKCYKSPNKRYYDGTGYYAKKQNGYNPYKCINR